MKFGIGLVLIGLASFANGGEFSFHEPKVLKSDGKPIQVASPGYACPCWADLNDDGVHELLVGQFAKGLIGVYEHTGDLNFGARNWLEAEGEAVEIPDVW